MDKKTILENIQKFEKVYDLIFDNSNTDEKICIGQKNTTCRFCNKSSDETTFSQIAHAIPESLGNKQIICLDECDNCNKFFSENLEDSLDKITLPYRTVNMIRGKKKVPTIKTMDKKARIDVKNPNERYMKIVAREDSNFIEFNDEKKESKMEFTLQPHIPAAAYKALVKMALSVIDRNELSNFTGMLSWIMSQNHCYPIIKPLKVLYTFIPGINVFQKATVLLFKRKENIDDSYPKYIFILMFGNVLYQIVVLSDDELKSDKRKVNLLKYFTSFDIEWHLGSPTYDILDWSSCEVEKNKKLPIIFSYEKRIPINPELIDLDSIKLG